MPPMKWRMLPVDPAAALATSGCLRLPGQETR
jgi:hypothetical protein